MRLGHREFDRLQKTLLELYAHRTLPEFTSAIPGILTQLIPSEYSLFTEFEIDRVTGKNGLLSCVESERRMDQATQDAIASQAFKDHPIIEHYATGDYSTAVKLSDFVSLAQLERRECYQAVFRRSHIKRLLTIPVMGTCGRAASLNVANWSRDFTESDRALLGLLAPHFMQACRNAELVTRSATQKNVSLEDLGLSARELEVAHWLVQGKSNPEIAIILGISQRTVEKHMERVLEKLGVENRTAAAVCLAEYHCFERLTTISSPPGMKI
jgi:DNA-binding CsgD family transcriptional regulator